jgi:hypothetical protein
MPIIPMWSEFIANIGSCKTWFNFTSDFVSTNKWNSNKRIRTY